jgi:hypothetical protein
MRWLLLPVLLTPPLLSAAVQDSVQPFVPFAPRAYRLVNGVAFSPDDRLMYFALLYREVLAHRGSPDTTAAELALFVARRQGDGWTEPELLPFSGTHADYEPALSPDGSRLIFNSKRPDADGRVPSRNDLWMVERRGSGWSAPRPLSAVNSFDLEESYATVDRDRRVVYVRGPTVEGGDDYDLYETRVLADGTATEPRRLPFSDHRFGEGDPQLAADGSFVIFTRWDHTVGWRETCDLFLAFRRGEGWAEPVALSELNSAGPDYAPALSSDGASLYYRASGRFVRVPLAPVVASARAGSEP